MYRKKPIAAFAEDEEERLEKAYGNKKTTLKSFNDDEALGLPPVHNNKKKGFFSVFKKSSK